MTISRFCKSCGAKITIDDSSEKFFCSFCGAENIVDSPDSNSTNSNAVIQPKSEKTIQPINSAFLSPSQSHKLNIEMQNQTNIWFDYRTTNDNVKMQVTIPCIGKSFDFENGKTLELYIPEGMQLIYFKIGKITYTRTINIQKNITIHMYCSWHGQAEIKTDIPYCVKEGNFTNQINNPTPQNSGPSIGRIIGTVCAVIALIFLISFIGGIFNSYLNAAKRAREAKNTTAATQSVSESTIKETQTAYSDPIVGNKTSFKDLKIGEVGKKGDVYVGLQYVKSSSTLPTMITPDEPSAGKTVILAFFEFYNNSKDTVKIDTSSITCYVDGVQATDVESYIKVYADGIHQYYYETLDPSFQLISVQDFEVSEEWQEIKFYYQSDCTWTISKNNVSENPYKPGTIINVNRNLKETKVDDYIISGKYGVQYKGAEIVCDENTYRGNVYYVVYKFNITNNSDNALDTSSYGSKMRSYQNNCFLGDTEYLLDDTIDGYIDINDIDSIEPGMSANVYIAFETIANIQTGRFIMIFDDGHGTNGVTHVVIT